MRNCWLPARTVVRVGPRWRNTSRSKPTPGSELSLSDTNQLGVDRFGPSKKREHLFSMLGSFEAGQFFIKSDLTIQPIEEEAYIFCDDRVPFSKLKVDRAGVCKTDGAGGPLKAACYQPTRVIEAALKVSHQPARAARTGHVFD